MTDSEQGQGAFNAATGRTLESDHGKPRYLNYQRELIRAHCGRTVLEVGAGLGEFADGFTGFERYVVTDVDPEAVRQMKARFADREEIEVQQFDIDGQTTLEEPVESLVAINVLEHIEDDVEALRCLAASVTPGGDIILFVPGYQQLYGEFDRKVGHYRRYTPATVRAAAEKAGLTVEVARPVNFLGAFAWWAAVRKGGAGAPNRKLVAIYDRFVVPVTRAIEKVVKVPFGQSVLCVARKPR
ncbi:methyltransferase [Prauserella marina]|uniref:2-polyprenyl-3-methyl-5-hydroxy-6-metoxy-1,4-benzoquinol methylase n=1 Tax=Prauserella marina TaxID=530584 RepID=A0A222VLE2_9PSEU|nr:class I SAM-dependent methyltransferase [Prauserella marina]ASR34583.1 methyltransferase [Prauserella marina]PWV85789.1 2-polyprenyl-3-methyl-5-hydroxy-6-metoxy-1,4-benzoquinol methylase [Prauserella marina]SDC45493.1 2-polyprenyl-3-methyl-5-hydroxy-6-metoxy-1,4-benzoquinol methylase [Prauserella marina]